MRLGRFGSESVTAERPADSEEIPSAWLAVLGCAWQNLPPLLSLPIGLSLACATRTNRHHRRSNLGKARHVVTQPLRRMFIAWWAGLVVAHGHLSNGG